MKQMPNHAREGRRYPAAPWNTHGEATFCLVRVPERLVVLPAGMRARSIGGQCMGVLAYIDYQPPSPLTYQELIWMPAAITAGGRPGYFVAAMYVDCERSLAAGRDIWALPKSLAQFDRTDSGVRIEAADGTRLTLQMRRRGPTVPLKQKFATIQPNLDREGRPNDAWVRFSCRFSGRSGTASVRIKEFSSNAKAWDSFAPSRRIPLLGASLNFSATMAEPTLWP